MIKDLAQCGFLLGILIAIIGFELRLLGLNEGVFTIGLLTMFVCGLVYAITDMMS